ncbi:MAG TPA: alpha/beta hydrolase, partial [Steroidobacteraceae bacterium]|nr:alpha/beta hydrolase [Steroidobacteraceae bacterium]
PVVGLGALEGLLDYNPATGLGALEVPFVLINSDYAPTDTSRIAAVTRDARFETVHGVGHFLMLEAPTEFNTLLEQAISSFMVAAEP